ncbi:DUF6351 family protein [Variovorax sp. OK605]|uniref:DUF6351 family protein n=1 Tax=Variovorax sp. OK605 TaxID=1855317 RepID=UPI00352949F0
MISGGDTLVEITAPVGVALDKVRVSLSGKDVTSQVPVVNSTNRVLRGLVTGLTTDPTSTAVSVSTLVVSNAEAEAQRREAKLVNYPITGPVPPRAALSWAARWASDFQGLPRDFHAERLRMPIGSCRLRERPRTLDHRQASIRPRLYGWDLQLVESGVRQPADWYRLCAGLCGQRDLPHRDRSRSPTRSTAVAGLPTSGRSAAAGPAPARPCRMVWPACRAACGFFGRRNSRRRCKSCSAAGANLTRGIRARAVRCPYPNWSAKPAPLRL